jgi:predicted nucleic acid-binding protein
MSDVRVFLDTNLFIYLYSDSDAFKKEKIFQTINQYERFVSTQVINEFCNVCIRKLKLPLTAIQDAVTEIKDSCNLVIVDDTTVMMALGLHEKYGYSFYDSLILASAVESECQYLFTEDMADGQKIRDVLTIKNIFACEE